MDIALSEAANRPGQRVQISYSNSRYNQFLTANSAWPGSDHPETASYEIVFIRIFYFFRRHRDIGMIGA